MNIENALSKFEEAAIKHSEATERGDHKAANKSYATIAKVISLLKAENKVHELSKFLDSPSIGIQLWAATYLLPINEINSVEVLEQIANSQGILSFDAQMTLKEWRNGNLKL